jgi:sarcosine oxidase subunit gamma
MSLSGSWPAGVAMPRVAARYGVKGTQAAAWLAQQGIAVPTAPNRVTHWSGNGGGRCLRLGNSEFLIEQDGGSSSSAASTAGAWQLLRSDCSVLLQGPHWPDLLAQLCAFDFQRFHDEPGLVVMTLLAGISVTLVHEPRRADESPATLRLWCDASYTAYLQECLQHIVRSAQLTENEYEQG